MCVFAVNWNYFLCDTWVLHSSMPCPLAVSQAANMGYFFLFPETIGDLTFGAGVSSISSIHTPSSDPGKSSL